MLCCFCFDSLLGARRKGRFGGEKKRKDEERMESRNAGNLNTNLPITNNEDKTGMERPLKFSVPDCICCVLGLSTVASFYFAPFDLI